MAELTRRVFVGTGLICALGLGRRVPAMSARLPVATPTAALGAIVAAVGGSSVHATVDRSIGLGRIRVGSTEADVSKGLLLKGTGLTRARFLDDARNASKLAIGVRDALIEALPSDHAALEARHKTWSRQFAKQVLHWDLKLRKSPWRGQRIADPHGRRYLLEWAGVTIDPGGKPGPVRLASLPNDATEPTPVSYRAYLTALTAAVS